MIIETRYAVEEDYSGLLGVREIVGHVFPKTVNVNRTVKALRYRSRVPIEQWQRLATTRRDAAEAWLAKQRELVDSARNLAQQREEDVAKAEAFLNTIK